MGRGFQAQPSLLRSGILLQAFCCVCGEGSLPVATVAHAEEALGRGGVEGRPGA